MAINLSKGGRVNLSKEAPGLKKALLGLGWDANASDTGKDFDLDASVFLIGADGKTPTDQDFVFYNNLKSPNGSVEHTGDNRTGEGDGDDEAIRVNLDAVPENIQEIIVVVTIHEAQERGQNFGQVRNAYVRIVDEDTGNEILKYELDEDFSAETAVEFGKLYRKDGSWRFQAVGEGYNAGLQKFVDKYITK